MNWREREKRIRLCNILYGVGVLLTISVYVAAAMLVASGQELFGYILLVLALLLAIGTGTAQVYGSVLTSDQIYEDAGMVPPRKRGKNKRK